ncbi:hypothetical protein [Microbulbifer taiwanensis]|uniref:Lipoprotein n=1 Tax=Microbulbifer taiwanensis TaxID=986746 RepID=A0ABW1YND5_9GAMM|nr:hypothetical protein [Microbulbifer taiwanensis]
MKVRLALLLLAAFLLSSCTGGSGIGACSDNDRRGPQPFPHAMA